MLVYFSVFRLGHISWRETEISQLKKISEISTDVEVKADDQILLPGTCVDDDFERRVVDARKIGENETEDCLQKLVKQSRSR